MGRKLNRDYFQFTEGISKMCVVESLDKNGCKLENLVINDKWKLIPTGNQEKPFKRIKLK